MGRRPLGERALSEKERSARYHQRRTLRTQIYRMALVRIRDKSTDPAARKWAAEALGDEKDAESAD